MAELSLPWTNNAVGDGHAYSDAEWAAVWSRVFGNAVLNAGVLKAARSEYLATGAVSPLVVQPGSAVVNGMFHDSDANVNVTVPTPGGATRLDRIVLRKNFTAQTVRLFRIAGAEGGGAPALVQTPGVTWDIPLWQISITTGGAITFIADERVYAAFASESRTPITPGGRLTLVSGTPVTTSDVSGVSAVTLYYTPFKSNKAPLYVNGAWRNIAFSELNLSLAAYAASTVFDVFLYVKNDGSLALESLAWASSGAGTSTRATVLVYQDGLLVKSGDATRLYLGTIMTTPTIGQTEDSVSRRLVWNYYNRVERKLVAVGVVTASGHIYNVAAWRAKLANTTVGQARVEIVVGVQESDSVEAEEVGYIHCSSYTASNPVGSVGIGLNSVVADSSDSRTALSTPLAAPNSDPVVAKARLYPPEGYNWLNSLEISTVTGTTTFLDNASGTNQAHHKPGLTGRLPG